MSSMITFLTSFGVTLAVFSIVNRIIHALLVMIMGDAQKNGESLRAGLVIGSLLNLLSALMSAGIGVLMRCVSLFGIMLFWYAIFYGLTSFWYVLYEDYPGVVVYWFDFYTKRIGPLIHGYLFIPLEFFNMIFKGVIPVYNGVTWVARSLFIKGLLPIMWDSMDLFTDFGVALLGLGRGLSVSIVDFVNQLDCEDQTCITKPAVLDLMTPMSSVRDMAVVASRIGGTVCSAVSLPFDWALYILIDARFSRAVHSLANALLHLVIHVPRTATKRCDLYGKSGKHWDILMCTPDVSPVFDRAVSGLRDVGGAVDNWLGVGAAMARRSLKGLPDDCTLRSNGPDQFRGELLSGLQIVVGLADWLMAATNGSHAYFWGQITKDVAVRQWPEVVDVRMGVAAVAYDDAAEVEISGVTQGQRPVTRQTTSLMGCHCRDTDQGIVVRCTVLTMQDYGVGEGNSFDVLFQDRTWSKHMTCAAADVSVRSVRWPVRRFEGKSVPFAEGYSEIPEADCMSRGSCESVDATIWLVPRCDLLRPEQCSDSAMGTSCFPFCMAIRVSGSRDSNPVFVNADVWRSGKQLMMRDCAMQSPDASAWLNLSPTKASVSTASYSDPSLSVDAKLFVAGSGDGSTCTTGSNMASWVPSNASARDPRSVPSFLRRRGQPFAIAGDTILLEFHTEDGASTVEVDRLSGNQRDVYSFVSGWAGLPTAPKLLVPIDELTTEERGRVTVPMDFVTNKIPSTASRNYVFYAVSPDMRIFEAYLDYCRDREALPKTQIMMLSSYSALRVYRVRAYCQENCEAGELTAQFTFNGFSDGRFTAANFPQDCSRVYNASIDALEYINEQNIAMTVQVADKTYNPRYRSGSNSTYVTYWLNPQTMRVKTGEMWKIELPSSLTAGLCVAADGVPHLGTLAAEVGVAGLHLLHRGVGALLYAPGMIAFWMGNSVCPLESRGHSVLESCGEIVFDLDDFFDSLDSASAIFWGIPGWIAEQMEQGKTVDYSPVSDLMRGVGVYGRGTVGINGLRGGIMSMLHTPIPDQLAGMYALVRQPGALAGSAKLVGAASSWSRFTAKIFAAIGSQVAMKLVSKGQLDLGELWRDTVNALYDKRPQFKSTITDRGISACVGLEMIFGGATPPGKLLYHSCMSSVRIMDGVLDLFLHSFADAPMVKCVCKDSAGRQISKYARENCVWRAPKTMQPILLGMIAASEGYISGDNLLCPAVIAYTKRALEKTMAPYFLTVYSSLDALGDSVDYLLSGFDPDAGQCSNFKVDPQVVVIMPEPVDYFRSCGSTTYCRTKCLGNWEAFDDARARYDPARLTGSRNLEKTVDSLFFPSIVAEIIAPGQIVALVRPDVCGSWVCRSPSDECIAAAFVVGLKIHVSFFCAPQSPSSVVYVSDEISLAWSSDKGYDSSRVSFLKHDGSALVYLEDTKIVLARRGTTPRVVMDTGTILSLPLAGMYPLRILDFIAIGERLLVSLAVRVAQGGLFERDVGTLWFSPLDVTDPYTHEPDFFPQVIVSASVREFWKGYAVSEYPAEQFGTAVLMMWPVTTGASLRRAVLTYTNFTVSVRIENVQQSQSLLARATMIPRLLVLSKTLREDAVNNQIVIFASAGNIYDWLRQLRLNGNGLLITSASLSNAQPVRANITVNTTCDGLDCRGCPDLALRSLCSAYQSCSVYRCIGTPVNLKRPLCGVGKTLKSLGNLGVTNVQGAWIMFVDIFMILLQLTSVRNVQGIEVNFPDDSFVGNICAAKDVSAEFFSILTSAVNSLMQRVQRTTGIFSHFSKIDSSVNTVISLSMAAITGFLHQLALAPVYVLAVGHKIMMCQVNGFLAITSVTGTAITIQSARFAGTDGIGGQCLTVGAEVNAQQTGDSKAVKSMAAHAAEILTGSGEAAVMRRLEPYMHMLDGGLVYLIGAMAKFADVLQTMDVQDCVLPDVTLKDTVRCACGDQPLSILPERKEGGLSEFAYWCTGTISLVDGDNRVQIVWNPYSYAELQKRIGDKLDRYVRLASSTVGVSAPNEQIFEEQGVSMFAVLTRCRQNFINKQWDPAAFVRYNPAVSEREIRGNVRVSHGDAKDGVGRCLLDSVDKGIGNGACLDSFLRSRQLNSIYWSYHMVNETVGSHLLDACMVFSGPASNAGISEARRKPFQDCLMGYGNQSACDLSGFVWSPSSSNQVPVAVRHPVAGADTNHLRDALDKRMMRASEMVMEKLAVVSEYSNDRLQASVFSAEGDVIHQLMDCVFMGPYARMDYWPAPRCDEGERDDCLVGPYWSRDENRGRTRKVDLDTCKAASELPFTCGSPTRRAMIKDFVKQYIEEGTGGADIVVRLVREWLQDMGKIWEYSPEKFNCDMCDNCCEGGFLPKNMTRLSKQLPMSGILNALESRLARFYRAAMGSTEPWTSELETVELTKYNWTTSSGFNQIKTHSIFHPSIPTQQYDAKEAASPFLNSYSMSLWRVCHSALKQVLFSMPVENDGSLRGAANAFKGGGPEVIASYVRQLVNDAKEMSPLFRHYQPRHHPSNSRMCKGSLSKDARISRGFVKFSDYVVRGNVILNGTQIHPIPVLGYDAASLGGVHVGSLGGLHEHLGFLDRSATEDWLRGGLNLTTSSEFMLRYGAGGLKVGNAPSSSAMNLSLPIDYSVNLNDVLKQFYSESDRGEPVESGALHGCDEHRKSATSLLEDFVDGLFPMAQAVRESGVGSYCLRFALELAMLYAMEMAPGVDDSDIILQKELVVSWRRRCGTQVQLVGMCNALDIYHYKPLQESCMFSWFLRLDPSVEMYMTPECLVKIGDSFYDPCQCKPEWCEERETTQVIRREDIENDQCRLGFDPRKVVQTAELGWWGLDETDTVASNWNTWLEEPVNLLDLSELHNVMMGNGHASGNVPLGQHWSTAEGFMNVTGEFCDMIADYWPDDASFPVGFHVSTPCSQADASYRSFDNVFALESDIDGNPRLAFMEDQTREADLVDSHFGAGGLCRGTNFAMDMYETNTIRVCTRITDGEDVDVHVPRGNITNTQLGLARCSDSSTELPWADETFYDYYDAAFYSVGTVPNLPSDPNAVVYPENGDRYMLIGPQHDMSEQGWGPSCQDFDIPNCQTEGWKCPLGFVCRSTGVCQHPSVQCTSHSECPGENMCSGLGTCEAPVISVENQLGEDASFRAHTSECAGESFSMRGASYWGYVPDVLEAHGMCSYRHWQEYLYTMDNCCQSQSTPGSVCNLQASSCTFYKFSKEDSLNKWWNQTDAYPTRLRMIPTTCDRDYERFMIDGKEMKSCVPRGSSYWLIRPDGTYQQTAERDKMWRVYDENSHIVPVSVSAFKGQASNGFLSSRNIDGIRSCMSIRQCYSDVFTKNGVAAMILSPSNPSQNRTAKTSAMYSPNRTTWTGSLYDPNDQFRCGVIGYYDNRIKKCVVDLKLFPIYYVLCKETPRVGYAMCQTSLKPSSVPARCDEVQYEYEADFSLIKDVNVPALTKFFYTFQQPSNLEEHLDMVDCMNYIYGVTSSSRFDSKGLYIPFTFTLYEIPFSWFYQCMLGSGIVVDQTLDRKLYTCTFYQNKINFLSTVNDYPLFRSYIFSVRGGYRREMVDGERARQVALMLQAWSMAIEEVRQIISGAISTEDLTYPKCYTELVWVLPSDSKFKRKMIEAYVRNTCADNVLSVYIQQYNRATGKNVDTQSALYELVNMAGQMVNQDGVLESNRLLTGLIKRFGSDHLTQKNSLQRISIASTPLQLNFSLPALDSMEFDLAKARWKELNGVMPNTKNERSSQTPPSCDLKDVYRDQNGVLLADEDTDIQSNTGSNVRVCSVYALGLFGCAYPFVVIDGRQLELRGNGSNVESNFDAYASALYEAVKKRYDRILDEYVDRSDIRPILMSNLSLFDEESSLGFGNNFKVNFTGVANYLNNINPDINTPVMCVAGNQQVDFNRCSDPNYAALKAHVINSYRKNGGVIVPQGHQLEWVVGKQMMSSGAIYSFTSLERNISKRFLDRMFDEDTVCGASSTLSSRDKLCYFQGENALMERSVIAPWLGGYWNPYDKCDVRTLDLQSGNAEIVDSLCYYDPYCPRELDISTLNNPYYANMPNRMCSEKDNERTQNINVNSRFLYNLCRHKLNEDSICNHTQGMLGGEDGSPMEDYDVGGGLFALHNFTKIPEGSESLFGNPLLSGGTSEYGFIRVSSAHIGGHQIGIKITSDGSMNVIKMPLKPVGAKTKINKWDSQDSNEWISTYSQSLREDEFAYELSSRDVGFVLGTDARGKPLLGWDCPLRRRAFYTGRVRNFKPQLPSARRSRRIFGGVTDNAWAHPIQRRQDGSARYGDYKTTNGFCFCPMAEEVWPGMCSVDTRLRDEHNCSLYKTVQAVRGAEWGWSHSFRPRNRQNEFKTCGVQVDWPFVEGYLRDNSTVGHVDVDSKVWAEASDVEKRRCHVLDRVSDFAYTFVSKRELRKSGFTTLARGVCHTGRVQKRHNSQSRCVRSVKGELNSTIRCVDNTGGYVERKKSKNPVESANTAKFFRRRCSKCTPVPTFATRNGQPMPAESSFGLSYRVSVERIIARDLKEALCKNNYTSCKENLNQSAWRKGEFMRTLTQNPKMLFKLQHEQRVISKTLEPKRSAMPDDSHLWERPWVYCPSRQALKTSVGCNGSISKARWRYNKVGTCYASILDALKDKDDPFAATDICNIDSRLTDVCTAISEAQSLVAASNCIKSGSDECSLQEYVYNPSTWESSNQAFVHQTVQEFYMRTDGCTNENDANCVCRADSALQQLRNNNSYRLRECSAVSVMVFRDVLVQTREMLFSICKVTSLLIDIAFNLLLMMSSSMRDVATSRIVVSWTKLKQESSVVVEKSSDMFFDLIFDTGSLGPYLKRSYVSACGAINTAYLFAANFWCKLVIEQLPLFLAALKSIGGWFEVGFSVVNDVFSVILDDTLPDAFTTLYQAGYREYFQSERYRQKQAAYEERKEASLLNKKEDKNKKKQKSGLIPADNKFLQNLMDARNARLQRTITRSGAQVAAAVFGKVFDIGNVILTGYDMYKQITLAMQIKEMLETFPTTFTLFDFDDFYLSIDGLVEFLNADFTCYSMSANVTPLQCTLLNFTEPSVSDIELMTPRASVCWAEAQQRQVGVSNLYSCTATSTCCSDPLNCDSNARGVRMCSECPFPPEGVRRYGCNTMLQRCQCGVEKFDVTRCASQRDCGSSSSCSLLTSLDDVSFGAMRSCTECATSPVCLMGNSQQYGQCSCLTSTDSKVDLCSDPVGTRVNPNAAKLCGFARDGGGYYAWSEISLVMCANTVGPFCAEVLSEDGALIYMTVSTRLRGGQVAYASRRLLSIEDDASVFFRLPSALLPEDPADDVTPDVVHKLITELEWNHTSAPCSTLAIAYRTGKEMGAVDQSTLHSCVYWRAVARQLIDEYGLVALREYDSFLLSAGDLSASIGQNGVLLEIMQKPWVFLHAMLYSQWAKPLRAILVASHDANVTSTLQAWGKRFKRVERSNKTRGWLRRMDHYIADDVNYDLMSDIGDESEDILLNATAPHKRRLLGLWQDTQSRIRSMPFYSLVKSAMSNLTLLDGVQVSTSKLWNVDAFFWKGVELDATCPLADATASLVKQSLGVTKKYYTHLMQINTPTFVRRRFKDVLPRVSRYNASSAWGPDRESIFKMILDFVGVSMKDVVSFLSDACPRQDCAVENRWTASYMVESLLFCDLESVMLCTQHKNDFIMSAVCFMALYIFLALICNYLGLSALSTLFFLSIPILVVWYSMGVSPRCFPLIPTCLFDDTIAAFKSLFPAKATLPSLLRSDTKTLKSCSELGFTSWEDPLAFAWCDLGFCVNLTDTSIFWEISHWRFQTMHVRATGPDADAYRVCASVTSTYTVPVLLALTSVFTVGAAVVISSLGVLGPTISLIWQIVLLDHSNE